MAMLIKREKEGVEISPKFIYNISQGKGYDNLLKIGYVEEIALERPFVPGKVGQRKVVRMTPYGKTKYLEQPLLQAEDIDLTSELA